MSLPFYLFPRNEQPPLSPAANSPLLPSRSQISRYCRSLGVAGSHRITTHSYSDRLRSLRLPAQTGQTARPPLAPKPIRHVEVIGHGLGSAVGLLLATALHLEVSGPAADAYENPLPPVEISATLFSLPRVGDQSFADWMDTLVETSNRKLRINRVTSFADTIAHLPERHLELAHPSLGEIWVGADPRVAYACRSASLHEESDVCSGSISLPRTSLLDHAGPFGGVWIGPRSCHRPKADPSAF